MNIEDQLQYFKSHPPRCVAKLRPREVPAPDFAFDGHGEELNTHFELGCPSCSETGLAIVGPTHDGPDLAGEIGSPYRVQCSSCESQSSLFDTESDGYDGELGHGSGYANATGPITKFPCACGDSTTFANVTARFEYSSDLFDDDYKGKPRQDLFSWFTLTGVCESCGKLRCIADFECA